MYDHYRVARQVATTLKEEGCSDAGKQIIADLGGSTGTEIFMALRWHLKDMMESSNVLSDETRQVMKELHDRLDAEIKR